MVVVLTRKEMSCLVIGMLNNFVARFLINIGDIMIFASAICFNLAVALKGALPFL